MPEKRFESAAQKRHEEFAGQIIASLEKGLAPWQKDWEAGTLFPPFNPVSGTAYSGINRVMLSKPDYADPRWMTFKQAHSEGYRVRKGAKSRPVVHWQWTKTVDKLDEDGEPVLDANGQPEKESVPLERPFVRFFSVFHASQLETENALPIPAYEAKEMAWQPHERAEALLKASGAVIVHDQRDRAFYRFSTDEIHLPPKENFKDDGRYYPTALHELGHWTRHPARLNRENGPFGSEVYAREELVAHIASWMLSQDLGIAFNADHQASYLEAWLKVLKDDPHEIFRACSGAERVRQYILGLEQKKERTVESIEIPARGGQEVPAEPAREKVWLAVAYRDKNEAKKAGARWDGDKKLWYAPAGTDLNKLADFLPEKEPLPAQAVSPVEEFRRLLEGEGFVLKGDPFMDGKLHRAAVEGGKPGRRDGAYQAYADGHPNGWFQNHKSGNVQKWIYSGQQLSAEQRTALRAEIERKREAALKEREARQAQASERVWAKFNACAGTPASGDHPYLKAKGVGNYGLHQDQDGNLLLFGLNLDLCKFPGLDFPVSGRFPSLDKLSVIRSLQTIQSISPEGEKRFEPGSRKKGAVFLIGEDKLKKIAYDQACKEPSLFDSLNGRPEILLAEGYATAASLYRATGLPVAAAFDAGNFLPAAEALRRKFPEAAITVCADNDYPLVRQAIKKALGDIEITLELEEKYAGHNKGLVKAQEAAKAVGGSVVAPQFTDEEKSKGLTDFNDLAQSRGLFVVTEQLVSRPRSQSASADLSAEAGQQAAAMPLSL